MTSARSWHGGQPFQQLPPAGAGSQRRRWRRWGEEQGCDGGAGRTRSPPLPRALVVQVRDRSGCHGEGSFQRSVQDTVSVENLKTHQSKTSQDPERLSFQRIVVRQGRAFLGWRGLGAVRSSSLSVRWRKALLLQVGGRGGRDEQKLGREEAREVQGEGPALFRQFPGGTERGPGPCHRVAEAWGEPGSGVHSTETLTDARSAPSRGTGAVRGQRGRLSMRWEGTGSEGGNT